MIIILRKEADDVTVLEGTEEDQGLLAKAFFLLLISYKSRIDVRNENIRAANKERVHLSCRNAFTPLQSPLLREH